MFPASSFEGMSPTLLSLCQAWFGLFILAALQHRPVLSMDTVDFLWTHGWMDQFEFLFLFWFTFYLYWLYFLVFLFLLAPVEYISLSFITQPLKWIFFWTWVDIAFMSYCYTSYSTRLLVILLLHRLLLNLFLFIIYCGYPLLLWWSPPNQETKSSSSLAHLSAYISIRTSNKHKP